MLAKSIADEGLKKVSIHFSVFQKRTFLKYIPSSIFVLEVALWYLSLLLCLHSCSPCYFFKFQGNCPDRSKTTFLSARQRKGSITGGSSVKTVGATSYSSDWTHSYNHSFCFAQMASMLQDLPSMVYYLWGGLQCWLFVAVSAAWQRPEMDMFTRQLITMSDAASLDVWGGEMPAKCSHHDLMRWFSCSSGLDPHSVIQRHRLNSSSGQSASQVRLSVYAMSPTTLWNMLKGCWRTGVQMGRQSLWTVWFENWESEGSKNSYREKKNYGLTDFCGVKCQISHTKAKWV